MQRNPTGLILLQDGTTIYAEGCGIEGFAVGELCFTTTMTGYQETLSDPSFAQQIITFTFPHIGNTGCNAIDEEADAVHAVGCVLREPITPPSSWRSDESFPAWLERKRVIAVSGVDTRALTEHIRTHGAPKAVIAHSAAGEFDLPMLRAALDAWQGLEGADLATEVSCRTAYDWDEGLTLLHGDRDHISISPSPQATLPSSEADSLHVVVIDYGVKLSILRCLTHMGCTVTVVPATMDASAICTYNPDGVFLSNGPGDPAATAAISTPIIRQLIEAGLVVYGICMGMQLIALASGGQTKKMHLGHRGGNQPVQAKAGVSEGEQAATIGKVMITSQNHGFAVVDVTQTILDADIDADDDADLDANIDADNALGAGDDSRGDDSRGDDSPDDVSRGVVTHVSLFDGSVEGFARTDRPVAAVQYHPEASPGPHDARPFFARFKQAMVSHRAQRSAR